MFNKVSSEKILSLIDLTSLNEADDEAAITSMCAKAISPLSHVAALCVYPQFVKQVVSFVNNRPIKIATVVNFPSGNDPLDKVLFLIQQAISDGANEIDVVFPYQQYLAGDVEHAVQFVQQCKTHCGADVLLKVILETGALNDLVKVADISRRVLLAGADFLKTSTGKIAVGATLEAAQVMLLTIKEMSKKLNRSFGFKASGGVRTVADATQYINLAAEIMGDDWVQADNFRLGASQLVDCL